VRFPSLSLFVPNPVWSYRKFDQWAINNRGKTQLNQLYFSRLLHPNGTVEVILGNMISHVSKSAIKTTIDTLFTLFIIFKEESSEEFFPFFSQ
jgi:hypothetical protein